MLNSVNIDTKASIMYLHNKYTKWYYSIIAHAKLKVNQLGYTELHHIIPKSLGGSNTLDNVVRLTPKEHYICHLLLTKMVIGIARRKMWYASYMMMKGTGRFKPSARMYEYARQNMIRANKERRVPPLGKKMSAEFKKKQSELKKGIPLGPMSEEHKAKLRTPKSEEHKQKISDAMRGRIGIVHSDETKKKMSAKARGRKLPTVECEYCRKQISHANYSRWHGPKCKSNSS